VSLDECFPDASVKPAGSWEVMPYDVLEVTRFFKWSFCYHP